MATKTKSTTAINEFRLVTPGYLHNRIEFVEHPGDMFWVHARTHHEDTLKGWFSRAEARKIYQEYLDYGYVRPSRAA